MCRLEPSVAVAAGQVAKVEAARHAAPPLQGAMAAGVDGGVLGGVGDGGGGIAPRGDEEGGVGDEVGSGF